VWRNSVLQAGRPSSGYREVARLRDVFTRGELTGLLEVTERQKVLVPLPLLDPLLLDLLLLLDLIQRRRAHSKHRFQSNCSLETHCTGADDSRPIQPTDTNGAPRAVMQQADHQRSVA